MLTAFDMRVESGRVATGFYGSTRGEACGAFFLRGPFARQLKVIVSDGTDPDPAIGGWEHVSVSTQGRHPPSWAEMCWIKNRFWQPEEAVAQFHPPQSRYVNIHPNCLHLWRRVGADFVLPPMLLV